MRITLSKMFQPVYSSFIAKLQSWVIDDLCRLCVSVAWVAHIILYMLIEPPVSPFLNDIFIKLDNVWGNMRLTPYLSVHCLIECNH